MLGFIGWKEKVYLEENMRGIHFRALVFGFNGKQLITNVFNSGTNVCDDEIQNSFVSNVWRQKDYCDKMWYVLIEFSLLFICFRFFFIDIVSCCSRVSNSF